MSHMVENMRSDRKAELYRIWITADERESRLAGVVRDVPAGMKLVWVVV